MIQYPIENDYITVEFDDRNGWVKTELRQKVLLQVSVRELHIDILKKDAPGFSMAYDEEVRVPISDSDILSLIPPQL